MSKLSMPYVVVFLVFLGCLNSNAQEPNQFRDWESKSGAFSVRAKLISNENGIVTIELQDDEKTIEVPVDKLSDQDQEYLNSLTKPKKRRSSKTLSKPKTKNAIAVKYPDVDLWNIQPDKYSGPPPNPAPIVVNAPKDQRIKINYCLSPDRQTMVIHNQELKRCAIVACSVADARPLGEWIEFSKIIPIGISPNKKQLLCFGSPQFGGGFLNLGDFIHVVETGEPIRALASWEPYKESKRAVQGAYFIDDDHVLTVNDRGDLGLWDLADLSLVWMTKIWPGMTPGLTANRKTMFAIANEKLVAIETLSGIVTGQVDASGIIGLTAMSVNDECTRLVGAGRGRMCEWDLTNGEMQSDFALAAITRYPKRINWVGDDYVLVDDGRGLNSELSDLVDLKRKAAFWVYYSRFRSQVGVNKHIRYVFTTSNFLRSESGRLSGFGATHTATLASVSLPHENCAKEIAQYPNHSNYQVRIPANSSINLKLKFEEGFDQEKEWGKLATLFSKSGLKIVREGGVADFHAVLRQNAADVQNQFDTPSHGKKFKMEITLVDADEVVWRASRDQSATDLNEEWSGFVIPREFNIVKRNLGRSSFVDGSFEDAITNRDYSSGWRSNFNYSIHTKKRK